MLTPPLRRRHGVRATPARRTQPQAPPQSLLTPWCHGRALDPRPRQRPRSRQRPRLPPRRQRWRPRQQSATRG
eukprot:11206611-Lingulodinium_polyedra.AAC.1